MSIAPQALAVILPLLASCAGSLPDPARMAADLPSAREVSVDRRVQLDADIERARIELREGRVTAARAVVELVLEYDPRAGRARAILAQCHLLAATAQSPPLLEEFRLAEGEFRRASALAPKDPLVARLHAGFMIADGHLSAAAQRIADALAVRPDDPELLEIGGRVNFDLGNELAAVELLAARLELVPDDANSAWRLAQCHARLCRAADEEGERVTRAQAAAAAFRRYGELAPQDVDGLLGEAWALLAGPDDDAGLARAVELYRSAAQLRPESADARYGIGMALARASRDEEARTALRSALELDPGHVGATLELAASLDAAGEHLAARALLERAMALDVNRDERSRIQRWLDSQAEPNSGRK